MDIRDYLEVSADSPSGLIWKKAIGNKHPGDVAMGALSKNGYYHGSFNKRHYYAHRVVYFLTHGVWAQEIDHKDRDRGNNKPDNLRSATRSENSRNRGGVTGVSFKANRWVARISLNGVEHYLGRFMDRSDAEAAYRSALTAIDKGQFGR